MTRHWKEKYMLDNRKKHYTFYDCTIILHNHIGMLRFHTNTSTHVFKNLHTAIVGHELYHPI